MFSIFPIDHYVYQKQIDKVIQNKNKRVTKIHKIMKLNNLVQYEHYLKKSQLKGRKVDIRV
jgi:hypothetical protein